MHIESLRWKLLDRPLLPIMASHVDALPFLALLALLFISAYALQDKGMRRLRPWLQIISFIFFVFTVHRCFGALRGWIFAIKDVAKDDFNVFYNLFIFIPVVAFTFLFGRVFCGWVCPLGALQELSFRAPFFKRFLIADSLKIRCFKLFVLTTLFGLGVFFLLKLSPQTFFFTENIVSIWALALIAVVFTAVWVPSQEVGLKRIRYLSLILWLLLIIFGIFTIEPWCIFYSNEIDYSSILSLFIVMALALLISQPWCRYLCPLGSFLSLLIKYSRIKIKLAKPVNLTARQLKNICLVEALKNDSLDLSSCLYCSRCVNVGISEIQES